ncbi:hypothetical protein BDV95DRAFT_480552 [Massariosphaeria phaeospora]|uniref:C3H1-type domain-containing protein n=1 Tax=Massariosphaeria phaeospora TaxID=100035 RepID=A0A7C8MH59_9PLEO|nr:hypothetical protein BDV95DRAFT_480552 [Massariosphaeria phaeospora]
MREERPLKPSVKEPTKQRESKAAAGPRRGSAPQVQLNDTAKSTATTLAGRKASHAAVADPTSAISAKAGVPVRPGENKPITAIRSSKPRQTTTVKRSGAQPGRAINIINDPNAITRRRWENSTKDHYSKLHFRHKADVHSRSEGKPDPSALVYVNGDPSGTIRSPIQERRDAPQNGDVYGRRDVGRPRQQPDPDYYTAQYTSKDTEMDLPEWEAAKIPLSCFEWRNGQCQYHSRQCRFLHRDKDPSGHPYKPSPVYGHVPGKYAQPPLTCLFWFERASGCSKSTDECDYAHKNTGLLAQSNGPPLPIDPAKQPNLTQPKSSDLPSSSLTCYFWLRTPVGCFHQPEACKFAHRNTGLLAFKDGSTEQIDPTEEPHSSVNKDHLTCFFWTQGKCKFSATDCIYQHRDTGVMGPGPSNSKWFPKKNIPLAIRMPKVSTGESASLAMDPPLEIPAADDAEFVRPPSPDNEPEGALSLGTNILAPALTCVDLKRKIEDICKLDFKIIFQYNGDGLKESVLDRRAFLIFHPEDHSEELELITRWLVMHHVEVCSFWFEGSWDYFKGQISDGGTGVIITHPDFDWYSEIPYFGQVLKHKVSIWSVGNQIGSEWDPSISTFLPAYRYDSIPIFPHGGFIYITDDVFTKKPMEALKIVELFIARIEMCRQVAGPIDPVKRVNDGCLIWRLAVRPDFMRNLYDTCEKHEAEIEALDPVQLTRVKLYELLTRTEYIEPDDDAPFEIHPDDYWPIISERQELMPDYFEALARSQEAANAHMIRLYSGMLIEHRQSYRQYFVVHTEPEKATWQNSITNIDEVMTPEKCIEYFEQPSKGNRFEFYDWAFPEIKVNDDAAAMDTS